MHILSHRGCWNSTIEGNSPVALRNALEKGFGFESDIRDYCGNLVISHNIADCSCQKVEEVFEWLHDFDDRYTFAINIKADGLKNLLCHYLDLYNINNYFLFDMSVPQMIEYKDIGLRFFTRQSEVEPNPCLYKDAAGVWIDGFWSTDWITEELLTSHIMKGKEVCIVSPELHGNPEYTTFWRQLKNQHVQSDRIMLCTDHPDEAKEFFNE